MFGYACFKAYRWILQWFFHIYAFSLYFIVWFIESNFKFGPVNVTCDLGSISVCEWALWDLQQIVWNSLGFYCRRHKWWFGVKFFSMLFFYALSSLFCVSLDADGNYQEQMLKAYCYYIYYSINIWGTKGGNLSNQKHYHHQSFWGYFVF